MTEPILFGLGCCLFVLGFAFGAGKIFQIPPKDTETKKGVTTPWGAFFVLYVVVGTSMMLAAIILRLPL